MRTGPGAQGPALPWAPWLASTWLTRLVEGRVGRDRIARERVGSSQNTPVVPVIVA